MCTAVLRLSRSFRSFANPPFARMHPTDAIVDQLGSVHLSLSLSSRARTRSSLLMVLLFIPELICKNATQTREKGKWPKKTQT